MALQETFEDKHRQQIIDQVATVWGDALQSLASPKSPKQLFNGGCLLLTRFRIVESHSVVFKHFSKPEDYGYLADGFAAKGVIHARLALDPKNPERCIDVFVTHLEARADDMRLLQYQEFADFVEQHSAPEYPFLLLGDFNTQGMEANRNDPDSAYSLFMKAMNQAAPEASLQDVWPLLWEEELGGTTDQESADIGKRIDYIMLGNPALPAVQLKPLSIEVKLYQDKRVAALSDHNAVVGEFIWADRPQDEK